MTHLFHSFWMSWDSAILVERIQVGPSLKLLNQWRKCGEHVYDFTAQIMHLDEKRQVHELTVSTAKVLSKKCHLLKFHGFSALYIIRSTWLTLIFIVLQCCTFNSSEAIRALRILRSSSNQKCSEFSISRNGSTCLRNGQFLFFFFGKPH